MISSFEFYKSISGIKEEYTCKVLVASTLHANNLGLGGFLIIRVCNPWASANSKFQREKGASV